MKKQKQSSAAIAKKNECMRMFCAGLVGVFLMGMLSGCGKQTQVPQAQMPADEAGLSAEADVLTEDAEETIDPATLKILDLSESEHVTEEVDLPEKFDLRDHGRVPAVRDQGDRGECWAFSALTALESTLLPTDAQLFDERHLVENNPYPSFTDNGGFRMMPLAYMNSWCGPVDDTQAFAGQLLEARMIRDKDLEAIKLTVYLHGAVETSVYMDIEEFTSDSESYDAALFSYYYDGDEEPNHELVIIGWDDTYPAESFHKTPAGDGAFLCQNSWGTEFGDNGIFYISYYDTVVGTENMAYIRFEKPGYFDGVYQSDLCGWTGELGYNSPDAWAAAVIEPEETAALCGVGFYTTDDNTDYAVYLVPDYEDENSLNDRYLLTSGYAEYRGYHTAEFEDAYNSELLNLSAEGKSAVVIQFYAADTNYPIAAEYAGGVIEEVVIDDAETFISPDGAHWTDTEDVYDCNVCMKFYLRFGE